MTIAGWSAAKLVVLHGLAAAVLQAQTGASRLMLAAVTDPHGHALVDLGPDDFVVQEGAAHRDILSVRIADYPIAVLLDTQASGDDFSLIQRAAVHFIERLGNDRPVIAGEFGTEPKLMMSFDDQRRTAVDRIDALRPTRPPESGTATSSRLLGAAALAAQTLHATGSLFSAIVVLSAGGDGAGETGPATVAPIIDSGAIVHVIAQQTMGGGETVSNAVKTVVRQTRGELTPIYSAASFQAALDRLVDRLGSEMLIEYLVPPGSKPLEATVGIRVPGARIRGLGVAPK